jgi:hypothetical protein
MALSRWDNEGGAGLCGLQKAQISAEAQSEVPERTSAELMKLRIGVIALENLVISLLAEAPDRQLDLAREMAAFISPRPGFTHHPLTIHAPTQMIDLVDPAGHFRAGDEQAVGHPGGPERCGLDVILSYRSPGDPSLLQSTWNSAIFKLDDCITATIN